MTSVDRYSFTPCTSIYTKSSAKMNIICGFLAAFSPVTWELNKHIAMIIAIKRVFISACPGSL